MFEINDDFDVEEDFLETAFNGDNSDIISLCDSVVDNVEEKSRNNSDLSRVSQINCDPSESSIGLPVGKKKITQESKKLEFLQAWNSKKNVQSSITETPHKHTLKSSDSPLGILKNVRPRKFPGPAGLLPERQANTSLVATEEYLAELESSDNGDSTFKEDEVFSQATGTAWETGAWGRLVESLGAEGGNLLETINLKSVRASAKHHRCTKVPFLAVLIQTVDTSSPDPCLLLRDTTGEMHGTLHRGVWEELNEVLEPGCVLVLRSVGVIKAGITSRRHFLNITANNIASIYTPHKYDWGRVINMNPILPGDCPRIVDEWKAFLAAPPPAPSIAPESPPKLYGSVIGGTPPPTQVPRARPPRPPFGRGGPSRGPPPPRGPCPPRPRLPAAPRAFRPPPTPPNPSKRPRMESPLPVQPSRNIFTTSPGPEDTSIVDSLFDGLDTDSLFGDF